MNSFTLYNPTRLVFGKGIIEDLKYEKSVSNRIVFTFSTRSGEEHIGDDTIAETERRFSERSYALGIAHNETGAEDRQILENCK